MVAMCADRLIRPTGRSTRHGEDDGAQIVVDGDVVGVVPDDDDEDGTAMETARTRQRAAPHLGVPCAARAAVPRG